MDTFPSCRCIFLCFCAGFQLPQWFVCEIFQTSMCLGLLNVKNNRLLCKCWSIKAAVIWVKCQIPVLIVHVSALGELLPSFHSKWVLGKRWLQGEIVLKLLHNLHIVEQGACKAVGCIPGIFQMSRVVLPEPLCCNIYIWTVLAHK